MRGIGFEPMKALSHVILSHTRLTASVPSHIKNLIMRGIKNFLGEVILSRRTIKAQNGELFFV